jgi:hypothetical protein
MELQTFSRYRYFGQSLGKQKPVSFFILFLFKKNANHTSIPPQQLQKAQAANGHVECNGLKFHLAVPKEMGGNGKGENPEQLFAMGYSGALVDRILFMLLNTSLVFFFRLAFVCLIFSFLVSLLLLLVQVAFLGRFRQLRNGLENRDGEKCRCPC